MSSFARILAFAGVVAAAGCTAGTDSPLLAEPNAPRFDSGLVGSGNFTSTGSTTSTVAAGDTASIERGSGMVGSGN